MQLTENDDHSYQKNKKQRGFGHGGLRLILLYLLQQRSQHAYELMNGVEALSLGLYRPSTGALYPVLNQLMDESNLEKVEIPQKDEQPSKGKAKVCYQLTDSGFLEYQRNREQIICLLDRVKKRVSRPLVVVRAIENLKYAVHLKLEHQGLTTDQAQQLADILDQAVQQIDKI